MKQAKLREWLEVVGIFAVVASLVFVGLQMQQTQNIAEVEMDWNNMMAELQSRSAIYEHPDIWARGNAGESLNPTEAVIYTTLIRDFNTVSYFKYFNSRRLEGNEYDSPTIFDTAGFLYENPGARREWDTLRATLRRYRNPHAPDKLRSPFEEAVRAHLALLDEIHNSKK